MRDRTGNDTIEWPQSGPNGAACIDFTSDVASDVLLQKIKRLGTNGVNSFVFSDGEVDWLRNVSQIELRRVQITRL